MERKWEAKLKQIEERAACYERKPLSSVYRPRLSKPEEPPSIWKLFHRQTEAFNFVKSCKEHVCKALQELYRVNCSAEDVFNLDSSTEEKFSRHLIFQLHDVAFKDNIHVGNFVRKILQPAFHLIASEDDSISEKTGHGFSHFSETPIKQGISFGKMSPDQDGGESWTLNSEELERLGSAKQSSPDLSFLVVRNNTGEKQLFVDLGVYTRNRNFRLYKSSKIGKHVALEIAEDNKFFPKHSETVSEENQCFLSSLVSNVRFSDTLRILTCDTSQNKEKRIECFSTNTKAENIEGFHCSPYPEIDQFVLSLVNKNGIQGGIRRWSYFFPEELLVYDICKYRWCENIRRAHKSNNIMILVDLKNEVWYQKCHDPVCKAENFKSDCFPLPAEVGLLFLLKEEEEFTATETMNSETENPHKPPSSMLSKGVASDADWDNGIDDTYFLEATEDAELAEAAENGLLSYYSGVDEIPDELILQVLQE
ncbi:DNA-directed primase/polymerase protein isoform X3 [Lynx rufus]|uniref:DNA-directed primase/polymerase protein isoform X3 n=1 Tax=Lynx rufus TaxID=61384 RepID=UPI001F12295A|nr:DNA-directed primase/polymerase protein isoform X3 [Lynx rufus]